MKVLVLLALVVCAVVAMPLEEEVDKRFLCNVDCLVKHILDPLLTLLSKDATEHVCEVACKAGIHKLVPLPLVDHACAPACKELQHLGKIHG